MLLVDSERRCAPGFVECLLIEVKIVGRGPVIGSGGVGHQPLSIPVVFEPMSPADPDLRFSLWWKSRGVWQFHDAGRNATHLMAVVSVTQVVESGFLPLIQKLSIIIPRNMGMKRKIPIMLCNDSSRQRQKGS